MEKEPWSGNINFGLVVCGHSRFLARGNSSRKFFGSWWLVVWVVSGSSDSIRETMYQGIFNPMVINLFRRN